MLMHNWHSYSGISCYLGATGYTCKYLEILQYTYISVYILNFLKPFSCEDVDKLGLNNFIYVKNRVKYVLSCREVGSKWSQDPCNCLFDFLCDMEMLTHRDIPIWNSWKANT